LSHPRLNWYASLPPPPQPADEWRRWLLKRCDVYGWLTAQFLLLDDLESAHWAADKFQILDERHLLLLVHTTEIVEVVEC
jgi:hypothetical protein